MKRHHQLVREHERVLLDRAIAALSEIERRTGKILAKGERNASRFSRSSRRR
jgi:hypothetical protein